MRLTLLCMLYITAIVNCDLVRIPLHKFESRRRTFYEFNTNNQPEHVVNLVNYDNMQYYSIITIGTPPQTFKVMFSICLPYLWVPSKGVHFPSYSDANVVHNTYDAASSTTYKQNGELYHIGDGSESFTGRMSYDDVTVGGITVKNQLFAEATYIPKDMVYAVFDGILGMDFCNITVGEDPPLFQSMFEKGLVKKHVFSFYLNRNPTESVGGELILGGLDPNHYQGEFWYINVARDGSCLFMIDKIIVGHDVICADGCQAIVETNTGMISGPTNQIERIQEIIGARSSQSYSVDCSSIPKLPNIDFVLAGKKFTLTGNDYILKIEFENETFCMSGFENGSMWMLGDVFLGKFYTQFDRDNSRIGFADSV